MTRILPPSSAGSSTFFSPPQSPGLMAPLPSPSPMCKVCLSPGSSVPRDEGHRAVLGQKKQAGTDAKVRRGGHIGLFIYCFTFSGLRVLHRSPSHVLVPAAIPLQPFLHTYDFSPVFLHPTPMCVFVCVWVPHQQAILRHQLGVLHFNSILKIAPDSIGSGLRSIRLLPML